MDATRIEELIHEGLPGATIVDVTTRSDHHEDDHYEATVVANEFDGESLVAQHQLVFDTLDGYMTTDIHALELSTYTPEEYDG